MRICREGPRGRWRRAQVVFRGVLRKTQPLSDSVPLSPLGRINSRFRFMVDDITIHTLPRAYCVLETFVAL